MTITTTRMSSRRKSHGEVLARARRLAVAAAMTSRRMFPRRVAVLQAAPALGEVRRLLDVGLVGQPNQNPKKKVAACWAASAPGCQELEEAATDNLSPGGVARLGAGRHPRAGVQAEGQSQNPTKGVGGCSEASARGFRVLAAVTATRNPSWGDLASVRGRQQRAALPL